MGKILFASSSQKNIDALTGLAAGVDGSDMEYALRADEAGRRMESGACSMLVVNTPLLDSQGIDLCTYVCGKLLYPVMLITSQGTYDRIHEDTEARGIITLSRPLEKRSYVAAFRTLHTASQVMEQLRLENRALRLQLEEIRLLNRAKAYLIRDMGMTEAQAHKFIEKQAMDLRITKAAVAQNILKTYYNK